MTQTLIFNTVMIIDDTQIDRYVASFIIRKLNIAQNIVEFDMATKAIDYLIEYKNLPEKLPGLILLDIRMPEMDGFQFLDSVDKIPGVADSVNVVMLTSSLDPDDINRSKKSKLVKTFINKPLNAEKLESIISILKQ